MKSLVHIGLVAFGLLLLCACGGGEDEPPGLYGEACDVSDPCAEGLECSAGLCTASCTDSAMCMTRGTGNTCVGGTCYTSCRDTINCPNGLVCTMFGSVMGTCRP